VARTGKPPTYEGYAARHQHPGECVCHGCRVERGEAKSHEGYQKSKQARVHNVWFDDALWDLVRDAARKADVSIGYWMRGAARAALRKKGYKPPREEPQTPVKPLAPTALACLDDEVGR
jgi:hypothetical protein